MTITLRNTKGSALTFNELDGNFTDLNSQIEGSPDSAQVLGLIDENALDSGRAIALIDSAYVNARADFDSAETLVLIDENALDSGRAIRLIDSDYVNTRVDSDLFMSITELKSEVAASADFAAFKSRIAAL